MTREQIVFLQCLSDYLNMRRSTVPEDIDVEQFCAYANQQQLSGIVYYQCKNSCIGINLQSSMAAITFNTGNRRREEKLIYSAFLEKSIPFLVLKGAKICYFYPIPELRSMGDVDLFIKETDKNRAHDTLIDLGYNCTSHEKNEWVYEKMCTHIELHYNFLEEEASKRSTYKIDAFLDSPWEKSYFQDGAWKLELEYHFVYLIIHLRQHLIDKGVGFRQFMDIVVTARQILDWEKVYEYLRQIDLLDFAQNCFALCERWFNVKINLAGEVSDEFYKNVTEQIFTDGVFGFNNLNQTVNEVANKLRKNNRILTVIQSAFPSYYEMRKADLYSFINGKPYLLPVAWFYRFYLKIKKDSVKSGLDIAFSPYTKKAELAKREAYLKQWGL